MDIIRYDTISAYNASLGLETEHPLVAVVHLDRHHELHEYDIAWGLYSLWLKDTHSCLINYGRTRYDYDCNSVMGFAPVAEVAYSLGFEYPQHFTRYFKRMTSLSPSQWRVRSLTEA